MAENKTTTIFNEMKNDIKKGFFQPNERLIEADLVKRYDASRNTIRNVLALLENDHLIVIEQYKGARVVSLELKDIINLYELRAEIEGYIFRKTVPTLSDADVLKMEKIFSQMANNLEVNDLEKHPELNNKFHSIVYNNCENQVAVDMVHNIKNQVGNYNFKAILIPGRTEETLEEHRNILISAQKRDGELAEKYVKEHISQISDTLSEYYNILT